MSISISITVKTSEGITITREIENKGGDNPLYNGKNTMEYGQPLLENIADIVDHASPY